VASRPGIGRLATLTVALALIVPATAMGTSLAASTGPDTGVAGADDGQGYWLAGTDGSVYGFGAAGEFGARPAGLRQPIAGVAPTPTGAGYWLVASDGGVFSFGDAPFLGSTGHLRLNRPVVGMAASRSGNGYWSVGADGGIFSFGDAAFYGSTGALRLSRPIVGMAPTPTGRGYWLVASDGGIFAFGDATFYGSTGALRLNKPIVGMAPTPTGAGYWLVASDGGVFSFGDAGFHGSTGHIRLNAPVVGLAPTPSGQGYWFVAADGGVFNFGDADFVGSAGGRALPRPVTAMAAVPAHAVRTSDGEPAFDPPLPAPDTPPDTGPDRSGTVAPPVPSGPFAVALIGDTGYSQAQDEVLFEVQEDVGEEGVALTIHIGDIWSEADGECKEADYRRVHDVFDGFAAPFVYTPGDNEWADCPGSSSEALATIRRIFFPTNETLGRPRLTVARQADMVENARFTQGGVVFVTINEPGPDGRGGSQRDHNIAWLNAAFDEAQAAGAPGVVVAWQDNPFEPDGGRLLEALKDRTEAFGKPVVLVHGDTHHHELDHPWGDVDNFTRVEVEGDSSSGEWMRMTVDPASPDVFSFHTERA
jgi:hypothetical protein